MKKRIKKLFTGMWIEGKEEKSIVNSEWSIRISSLCFDGIQFHAFTMLFVRF